MNTAPSGRENALSAWFAVSVSAIVNSCTSAGRADRSQHATAWGRGGTHRRRWTRSRGWCARTSGRCAQTRGGRVRRCLCSPAAARGPRRGAAPVLLRAHRSHSPAASSCVLSAIHLWVPTTVVGRTSSNQPQGEGAACPDSQRVCLQAPRSGYRMARACWSVVSPT